MGAGGDLPARVLAYLNSVFFGQHPQASMSVHTVREMRTIAMAIDGLLRGELPEVGDLLIQRLKALEQSVRDRDWSVASQLELADERPGLVSLPEQHAAARHAVLQHRLADLRARQGRRPSE